jgi:hypothetical protein
MGGVVAAVSCGATHTLSKPHAGSNPPPAGLGVAGDAHRGDQGAPRGPRCCDPDHHRP